MKTLKLAVLFVSTCILCINCKESPKKAVQTEPIAFTKEGELSIIRQKVDTLITKLAIEFAESDYETQTGLMYRKSMNDDRGMFFIFKEERLHSFYMKNTEIALDIIFMKADLTIASLQENAQPYNENGLSSKVPIKYVLEVNAGFAKKWSLEEGDKIVYFKN